MVSDASLWINYKEFLNPDGTVIQKLYGKEVLYEMSDVYNSKQWKTRLRLANKNWRKNYFDMANGESVDVYIDLIGSFLNVSGAFLPALSDGELLCRSWWYM